MVCTKSNKMKLIICLLIIFLINAHAYPYFDKCTSIDESRKILNTIDGQIRGECYSVPVDYPSRLKTSVDVYTWLSIPYAAPITSSTRFQKTKPFGKYAGIRDGTKWPKACRQKVQREFPGISWEDVKLENMSEDCLYLNVFARSDSYLNKNRTKLSPILFYIHKGSFVIGDSATDLLEPSTLVAMSGMIVVTFNYRLDTFGLLHLSGTEASGNQAFHDQAMALKWVYENAHTFGGDRNSITISGTSAGAISVGFHLFAPSSWPYFNNAILESGGPMVKGFELVTSDVATMKSKTYLASFGCDTTKSNEEILKCARDLDANRLADETTGYYFIIDNVTFNKSIEELAKEKSFKKCKILTGFNTDEFVLFFTNAGFGFLGSDPLNWNENAKKVGFNEFNSTIQTLYGGELTKDKTFYDKLIKQYFSNDDFMNLNKNSSAINYFKYLNRIQSDYVFICQSFNMAQLYRSVGLDAYMYEFGYRISSTFFPESLATAVHVDQIPLIFGEPLAIKVIKLNNFHFLLTFVYFYFTLRNFLCSTVTFTLLLDILIQKRLNCSVKNLYLTGRILLKTAILILWKTVISKHGSNLQETTF
jgi:carboxylesterase type B